MQNYKLELSAKAERELEKFVRREPQLYRRLVQALDDLTNDPYQGKLLKGQLQSYYSYRVGSYRIVYQIYRNHLLVIVIDIGHRRDIYR